MFLIDIESMYKTAFRFDRFDCGLQGAVAAAGLIKRPGHLTG